MLDGALHALRRGLPKAAAEVLDAWWDTLPAAPRRELAETCRVAPRAPNGVRVVGRFDDDRGEGRSGEGEFPIDLYEYLVNHEISLRELDGRTFHICTAHERAASVARAGHVPATFTCPLGREACPMRRVLALGGGRSLRLEIQRR